jgi:uncharacterized tellurite resistance protein B-like protein
MARRRRNQLGFLGTVGTLALLVGALGAVALWPTTPGAAVLWMIMGLLVAWPVFRLRRWLRERRDRKDFSARMVPQHIRILEDCLRVCRQSGNATVRESRAELAIEKISAIDSLAPGRLADREELLRYFRAVSRTAAVEAAWRKFRTAATQRTREKQHAVVRDLVAARNITDQDLSDSFAMDSLDQQPLSLARLLAGGLGAKSDVVADPPPRSHPRVDTRPASRGDSPPAPAPRKRAAAQARWIPPGEPVAVAGLTLPGGLLYVGQPHADLDGEPALIDPALSVDLSRPDRAGVGLAYWPAYDAIGPACRAAYLEWLAGGRQDPGAAIGYVFLFFYGLERRVFMDGRDGTLPRSELEAIRAELERLRELYREDSSFEKYARAFLEVIDIAHLGRLPAVPPETAIGEGLSPGLRAALAGFAVRGEPIPAPWALSWVRAASDASVRSAVHRAPDEYRTLFTLRYEKATGGGLRVQPNKAPIRWEYRPASAALQRRLPQVMLDLPDIARLTGPLRRLEAVAARCAEDLNPYARWIARRPGARNSLPAWGLLPTDLAAVRRPAEADELQLLIEGRLGGADFCVLEAGELLSRWPCGGEGRSSKGDAVLLVQVLERLGLGLEPDVRFDGPVPMASSKAVLFRLPHGAPASPSPAYEAATLVLRLAAAVATADGAVSTTEESLLFDHVERSLALDHWEKVRLGAHFRWLSASRPELNGIKRRIARLNVAQRTALAQHLVELVVADGHIDPGEVRVLARVYKLLELDPGQVHSDLHHVAVARQQAAAEPVTVCEAPAGGSGFRIPSPSAPAAKTQGVVLDATSIERKLAESAAVSALLHGIFSGDEPAPAAPTADAVARDAADSQPHQSVAGLDEKHSQLLLRLAERPTWSRPAFEELASGLGLLPDGALETLNEAAFAVCEAPLCEDGDPLATDPAVVERLIR